MHVNRQIVSNCIRMYSNIFLRSQYIYSHTPTQPLAPNPSLSTDIDKTDDRPHLGYPTNTLAVLANFQTFGMTVPFVAQKDMYKRSIAPHTIAFTHPPPGIQNTRLFLHYSRHHLSSTPHIWRYYTFFWLIALVLISLTEFPLQTHITSEILTLSCRTI